MTVQEYELTKINISDLHFDETNPNQLTKEQEQALKKAMKRFGYLVPIVINENYEIGDGEHRAKLYKEMGLTEIPAYIVPKINDDIERRLLRQTMNKLRGEHEIKMDADEIALIFQNNKLNDLTELLATQRDELENILTKHKGIQFQHEDNFDIDKELEDLVPVTELGDIWQLGNHRIVCGDCTDKRIIDKLLEDNKIAQLNADPPYGVLYGDKNKYMNERYGFYKNRIIRNYENDKADTNYYEIFNLMFENIKDNWAEYSTIYIWCADKIINQILNAFNDNKITAAQILVWLKSSLNPTRTDYYYLNEFCIYGWHDKHKFYSQHAGGSRNTVLEYDKPMHNSQHPAMKPIAMISQTIQDGTQENEIVLDCFLGSGTTLIACEQTNRICRGVEIDPRYIDICVKRFQGLTGKEAIRLKDNKTYNELKLSE